MIINLPIVSNKKNNLVLLENFSETQAPFQIQKHSYAYAKATRKYF